MTRVDDVINTAGHRISTGRLEEVLNEVEEVVESAVVGYNDPLRGECALAFVVLKGKGTEDMSEEEIAAVKASCQLKIRNDVGAFCRLYGVIIMNRLPKTRSGKIVRGTIRKIVNKQDYVVPATIEDDTVLDEIK
jgi:propionyl-CoA synthetase